MTRRARADEGCFGLNYIPTFLMTLFSLQSFVEARPLEAAGLNLMGFGASVMLSGGRRDPQRILAFAGVGATMAAAGFLSVVSSCQVHDGFGNEASSLCKGSGW